MPTQLDMRALIEARSDVLLMTIDTLRYDVAVALDEAGRTPNLSALIGGQGWERRHTPGTFTFAAHQAFFAGFLPTPAVPGHHPRLFAAAFEGSATTRSTTCVFEEPNIVHGLAARGYHTVCIGGVGFFNKRTALGQVLPGLFKESHWSPKLGVTTPRAPYYQMALAAEVLGRQPADEPLFLFINVSALHQPNNFYSVGATSDTIETHAAALEFTDGALPLLAEALAARGRPTAAIICADHGTAYGEEGFTGHRNGLDVVTNVPYAQRLINASE